jgi:hypothetical protein
VCATAQTAQKLARTLEPSTVLETLPARQWPPAWEPDMKTQNKAFPLKHLMVMTATGTLDLNASKAALKSLIADPGFDARSEVLLDLRDVECAMSVTDIYELAVYMAAPNPALPTYKKIAVLVAGHLAFDHARFLEMCGGNRGLKIGAFVDYESADEWLNADLPADPKNSVPVLKPKPTNSDKPRPSKTAANSVV